LISLVLMTEVGLRDSSSTVEPQSSSGSLRAASASMASQGGPGQHSQGGSSAATMSSSAATEDDSQRGSQENSQSSVASSSLRLELEDTQAPTLATAGHGQDMDEAQETEVANALEDTQAPTLATAGHGQDMDEAQETEVANDDDEVEEAADDDDHNSKDMLADSQEEAGANQDKRLKRAAVTDDEDQHVLTKKVKGDKDESQHECVASNEDNSLIIVDTSGTSSKNDVSSLGQSNLEDSVIVLEEMVKGGAVKPSVKLVAPPMSASTSMEGDVTNVGGNLTASSTNSVDMFAKLASEPIRHQLDESHHDEQKEDDVSSMVAHVASSSMEGGHHDDIAAVSPIVAHSASLLASARPSESGGATSTPGNNMSNASPSLDNKSSSDDDKVAKGGGGRTRQHNSRRRQRRLKGGDDVLDDENEEGEADDTQQVAADEEEDKESVHENGQDSFKKPHRTSSSSAASSSQHQPKESVSLLVLSPRLTKAQLAVIKDYVAREFPKVAHEVFEEVTLSQTRAKDFVPQLKAFIAEFQRSGGHADQAGHAGEGQPDISPALPVEPPAKLKASRLSEGSSTSSSSRCSGGSGYQADRSTTTSGSSVSGGSQASSKRDRLSLIPEEPIKPHSVVSPLPERKPLTRVANRKKDHQVQPAQTKVNGGGHYVQGQETSAEGGQEPPTVMTDSAGGELSLGSLVFAKYAEGTQIRYWPAKITSTDANDDHWTVRFFEDDVKGDLPMCELIPASSLLPGQRVLVVTRGQGDDGVFHDASLTAFPDLSQANTVSYPVRFDQVEGIPQVDEKLVDFKDLLLTHDQAKAVKKELGGRWTRPSVGKVRKTLQMLCHVKASYR
jgi:hypothetical protein